MTSLRSITFRIAVITLAAISITCSPVIAQTPAASPADDQIALFAEQREALQAQGRAVMEGFLAGDDSVTETMAPELLAGLGGVTIQAFMDSLETNRIRMELPEAGAWFDAHVDGSDVMQGFFYQGSASTFELTAAEPQAGPVPSGRWTGSIGPGVLEIEITFVGTADDLAATISIPSQGLGEAPMSNVTFSPSQPVGDLVEETAVPFAPATGSYTSVHAWGDDLRTNDRVRGDCPLTVATGPGRGDEQRRDLYAPGAGPMARGMGRRD
jgi:hypothetical protein